MDTRPPREVEHSQDEKENLELLMQRREAFLDGNIQNVQDRREDNLSAIENLEKAIEGNALLIENLKKQKMQAIEDAMQSKEKGLTISKPRMFDRITKFFSDRFNPARTVQNRVLSPFKFQIDSCAVPENHSVGNKTEEEAQNEFVKNVQSHITQAKEKYAKPIEKIHTFVKATEEAAKKVGFLGGKKVDEKISIKKGLDEEITI